MTTLADRVKLLGVINLIWSENPHLRLTQLIGNCFEAGDLYYVEDKELEKRLREVYLGEN